VLSGLQGVNVALKQLLQSSPPPPTLVVPAAEAAVRDAAGAAGEHVRRP
jgi:hypothetical protein